MDSEVGAAPVSAGGSPEHTSHVRGGGRVHTEPSSRERARAEREDAVHSSQPSPRRPSIFDSDDGVAWGDVTSGASKGEVEDVQSSLPQERSGAADVQLPSEPSHDGSSGSGMPNVDPTRPAGVDLAKQLPAAPAGTLVMAVSHVLVDTQEALADMLAHLENAAILALDVDGIGMSTDAPEPCVMQLSTSPSEGVYLVDLHVLGEAAFSTRSARTGATLAQLLESPGVMKYIWDCRLDSWGLFRRFGVRLENVVDLQVMDVISQYLKGREVVRLGGLSFVLECTGAGRLSPAQQHRITHVKDAARGLLTPERGGTPQAWKNRPLSPVLQEFCSDVCHLFTVFNYFVDYAGGRDEYEAHYGPVLREAVDWRLQRAYAEVGSDPHREREGPGGTRIDPPLQFFMDNPRARRSAHGPRGIAGRAFARNTAHQAFIGDAPGGHYGHRALAAPRGGHSRAGGARPPGGGRRTDFSPEWPGGPQPGYGAGPYHHQPRGARPPARVSYGERMPDPRRVAGYGGASPGYDAMHGMRGAAPWPMSAEWMAAQAVMQGYAAHAQPWPYPGPPELTEASAHDPAGLPAEHSGNVFAPTAATAQPAEAVVTAHDNDGQSSPRSRVPAAPGQWQQAAASFVHGRQRGAAASPRTITLLSPHSGHGSGALKAGASDHMAMDGIPAATATPDEARHGSRPTMPAAKGDVARPGAAAFVDSSTSYRDARGHAPSHTGASPYGAYAAGHFSVSRTRGAYTPQSGYARGRGESHSGFSRGSIVTVGGADAAHIDQSASTSASSLEDTSTRDSSPTPHTGHGAPMLPWQAGIPPTAALGAPGRWPMGLPPPMHAPLPGMPYSPVAFSHLMDGRASPSGAFAGSSGQSQADGDPRASSEDLPYQMFDSSHAIPHPMIFAGAEAMRAQGALSYPPYMYPVSMAPSPSPTAMTASSVAHAGYAPGYAVQPGGYMQMPMGYYHQAQPATMASASAYSAQANQQAVAALLHAHAYYAALGSVATAAASSSAPGQSVLPVSTANPGAAELVIPSPASLPPHSA